MAATAPSLTASSSGRVVAAAGRRIPKGCAARSSSRPQLRPLQWGTLGQQQPARGRVGMRASEERYEAMQESLRNQAAKDFEAGVKAGKSEDEIVAQQFGAKDPESMSDVQKAYAARVKENLAKRAAELKQEESKRPGNAEFEAGKRLYGRGKYREAEEVLLKAVELSGSYSKLGGEIQLWLALAYQANNKMGLCIELYKDLETFHPMRAIQKQAAELRFIMEAPRLPSRPEDKVKIPIIDDPIRVNSGKSYQPMNQRRGKKVKKSLEEQALENYTPPKWVENRYVWAAAAVLCSGLAYYSTQIMMNSLNRFIAFFGGAALTAAFVNNGLDAMFDSMADRRAEKAYGRMMAARVAAEKQKIAAESA
eukprot:jgi/Tetstr1/429880/TSEL_019745.t1